MPHSVLMLQATSQTVSASFTSYWAQILATLTVFGVVIGFVAVAVFDAHFIRAFDRCRDRIMSRLDTWYADRVAENAHTAQQVKINSDRIEGFGTSLTRQGDALQTQLGAHFSQSATALHSVVLALTAVQKEAQATAQAVARIEGYIEGGGEIDHLNRRKRTRRKPTSGDES
jgi:hypothetical protein